MPIELEKIFDSIARRMRDEFETVSGQVEHHGSKGRLRETVIREYVQRWVTSTVEVGGPGEIIDSHGNVSPECDVLIFDPTTPKLIDERDFRVLPVECLFGVIQVKSRLNGEALRQDYGVIQAAKALRKTAFRSETSPITISSNVYGKEWHHFPTWGCIFSFSSMSLDAILNEMNESDKDVPVEQRTDMVVVLGKGVVLSLTAQGQVSPWYDPEGVRVAIETNNPLLLMTVSLQQVTSEAWMPKFDIRRYLDGVEFGKIMKPRV